MTLTAPCAKCGRTMTLEAAPEADSEINRRFAAMTVCDSCNPNFKRAAKPAPAKPTTTKATEQNLPYADD